MPSRTMFLETEDLGVRVGAVEEGEVDGVPARGGAGGRSFLIGSVDIDCELTRLAFCSALPGCRVAEG